MAAPKKIDIDTPDPAKLARLARQTLSSAERRRRYRQIDFLDTSFWYPAQLAFFRDRRKQRLIHAGNQLGKTKTCAAEVAWHLTGDHPSWWQGHRFAKPIRAWACAESLVLARDGIQRHLCGGRGDDFGTGTIPLEAFSRAPVMVPGGTGAIDTIYVNHKGPDGTINGQSSLTFKSFDMRRERLQSETLDLIWIDERPEETLFNELYARTFASNGIILVSYTPIGPGAASGVTYRFLSESNPDRGVHRITSEEARHIPAERRAELEENIPDHEKDARLEGLPALGSGPVFPLQLISECIKPFIPETLPQWGKWCVGIDPGYGHPFAAVLICWVPDLNDIYVTDAFRMERASAVIHTERINRMCRGLRIPVAYPADILQHEKGSGETLALQYKNCGLKMMAHHAKNQDGSNYVEPALSEIRELMVLGKLHIAQHLNELQEEMRLYHRDEHFRLVKEREDLVCAMRYAIMSRRFGKKLNECDGVGYGPLPFALQQRGNQGSQFAEVQEDIFER